MKTLRRTLLAVLLATQLIGCTEQPSPAEPKSPKQDALVLQEMEPIREPEIAVKEGITPTRETENMKLTSKPVITEPKETEPAVKSENSTAAKSEKPQPTATEVTTPVETEPIPTTPRVTEPPVTKATVPPTTEEQETQPTLPVMTEPPTTEPPTTAPAVTEPPSTEPPTTEPSATEAIPDETEYTEPPAEYIDTYALESYGRSYASSAYGYNGTSDCHPGSGAGYFPAATKEITSMEDGYWYVQQAIDSQYSRDVAYGYSPYEEINGVIVRCPINVSVDSAGGNTYTITVYYGGTA